ncbi:PSD1 and planctomycete cytochrome C domain-containing protein [Tundrisphaera sp. TA3]|uniref:PSD1 and planctomycete cytochrome C domain-containing protein n=1 Tax=Tundrisphaera sp. TA3 TaxID=3435775 RepID=UPI003EB7E224
MIFERLGWAAILTMWAASGAALGQEPAPQKAQVDFAHDVAPLLKARCTNCHADGRYKGAFSLDTRESMLKSESVVVGKASESELIERLTSDDPEFRMPPPTGKEKPLTPEEVLRLSTWIDQGATWEPGFTFKSRGYVAPTKLQAVELPPARDGRDHPIDRIIDAYQAARKVPTPAPLDDAAFARRLFLDVTGLLPPPEELAAFLADADPGKRDRLIRRVLGDDRAYADNWLSFWNDLLRNDYKGTGYIDGGRKQISQWLYQALYDNKPYDAFVRDLISPTPESEGFINGIKWRGRVNASQVTEVQFSQNVAQVFLGVNMKCASCHDSFIDRWTLEDAYGLAAITASAPLEIARCDIPTGRFATPKFLWPELGSIDAKLPRDERLKQLAGLLTHPDNGRFPRTISNRIWRRLMGRGIIEPVDVMANEPWSEPLLDHLAGFLAGHGYDLKALIEHVATSKAYQSRSAAWPDEDHGEGYVYRGPEVKRMTAEDFMDAVWMITGEAPKKLAAPIKPAAEAEAAAHRFVRASLVLCDPLMRSLGRPNREQVVTTRGEVLTTLQALDLSNGQTLTEIAAKGADRLLAEKPGADASALAEAVYSRALGRSPTADEAAIAREMIGDPASADGLADLLWAVFMLPEFQLIR